MAGIKRKRSEKSHFDFLACQLNNAETSDMVIYCDNEEFPAHRLIVCPQSDFFNKACGMGCKIEKIEISDGSARLVGLMLRYLYTGCYEAHVQLGGKMAQKETQSAGVKMKTESKVEAEFSINDIANLNDCFTLIQTHADMCVLAWKHGVPSLEEHARRLFATSLDNIIYLEGEHLLKLARFVYTQIRSLPPSLYLRRLLVAATNRHYCHMLNDKGKILGDYIGSMLGELPEFAMDLLRQVHTNAYLASEGVVYLTNVLTRPREPPEVLTSAGKKSRVTTAQTVGKKRDYEQRMILYKLEHFPEDEDDEDN